MEEIIKKVIEKDYIFIEIEKRNVKIFKWRRK